MYSMKKTIIAISALALIMLVVSSMPLSVKAHPGKTDGNGGHTNRSTGEYHYHHGYSAHDHYDMDGDGDVDCPYDFRDKTGASSGDGSGRSNISSGKTYNSNTEQTTTKKVNTVEAEVDEVPTWIYWVIAILSGALIIMFLLIRSKCEELSAQKRRFKQEETEAEARVRDGICALHNALVKKYGEDYLYRISNAPDGDYVDNDFLPHSANYSVNPCYDKYTFFLGSSPYNYGSKYHHSSCRYGRSIFEINAYNIRRYNRYQSCSICSPSRKLPNTEWVDEYIKHYKFVNKYVAMQSTNERS